MKSIIHLYAQMQRKSMFVLSQRRIGYLLPGLENPSMPSVLTIVWKSRVKEKSVFSAVFSRKCTVKSIMHLYAQM